MYFLFRVGDTFLQGSWGDCISTSRLGERATARVLHAAIATTREEGDSMLSTLYTLSHSKSTKMCEVHALLFSFYTWKYWDLIPKLMCSPNWGLELESVWLWNPSSFLCAIYTNLPQCFYYSSETLFTSITPLNLYCRLCLQYSYLPNRLLWLKSRLEFKLENLSYYHKPNCV